jgi:KipI family sensor histidine kinase inhibitor
VLIELDDLEAVLRLAAAVEEERSSQGDRGGFGGVIDVVAGARTLLLRCHPGGEYLPRAISRLHSLDVPHGVPQPTQEVTISVVYDGADLDDVAELTGLSRDDVVSRHQETEWRVAFTGFAPGFAYLVGGDGSLHVPRRNEPRTSVPAGAVGLAGEFSGIYPTSSPGGWQLIGHTTARMWDPHREPPALLSPGTSVRFTQGEP